MIDGAQKERVTQFAMLSDGNVIYEADLSIRGVRYRPYPLRGQNAPPGQRRSALR